MTAPRPLASILPGETERALARMTLLAQLVADALDDLELVSTVHDRAHSLGPVLDPTAYARGMSNLAAQAELLGPLLTAARRLAPIVARYREEAFG